MKYALSNYSPVQNLMITKNMFQDKETENRAIELKYATLIWTVSP